MPHKISANSVGFISWALIWLIIGQESWSKKHQMIHTQIWTAFFQKWMEGKKFSICSRHLSLSEYWILNFKGVGKPQWLICLIVRSQHCMNWIDNQMRCFWSSLRRELPKSWPDAPSELSRTPVAAVQAPRESHTNHIAAASNPLILTPSPPPAPPVSLLPSSHLEIQVENSG